MRRVREDTDAGIRWGQKLDAQAHEEEAKEEEEKAYEVSPQLVVGVWVLPEEYASSGFFWETTSSSFSALHGSSLDACFTHLPREGGARESGIFQRALCHW